MVIVKFLSWLLMAVVGVAIIGFCVANRGPVTVDLWPLPMELDRRLFEVVLAALLLGFLWGALATWLAGSRTRNKARQRYYELDFTQRELRHVKDKMEKAQAEARVQRREAQRETDSGALPPANAA
ncbi:MAG: LapA family protein [Hyphomicrobiales bacterium]|nr:LapA family protein [Hyphomicrobiales bacterium]